MKKKFAMLMAAAVLFLANGTVTTYATEPVDMVAQIAEAAVPQANYGMECCVCGRVDCLQFLYYEQAGIGGTTHRIYYKCTNCGGTTIVVMNAR